MQKRVLIADDDTSIVEYFRHLLSRAPFAFSFARDGREALDMYRGARESGEPFDLLVLDSMMPQMSGLAVAEAIRVDDRETPIFLFTADPSPLVHARATLYGVCAVWEKPLCVPDMEKRIIEQLALIDKPESEPQP